MSIEDKVKYTIKLIISYFLYYIGFLSFYKMVKLRNKAIVLMYHRVLLPELKATTFSHDGIIVDIKTFERHICFLKNKFDVMSLDEFTERLQNRIPFKRNSCLITFDDGWKDNFTYAYPILRQYEVSAVIFLPVNYIDSKKQFWQEKLAKTLADFYHTASKDPALLSKNYEILKKYNLHNILDLPQDKLRSFIVSVVNQKKKYPLKQIEKMRSQISVEFERKSEPESNNTFLCWDEIKSMLTDGISYGSHGVDHKILTKIPSEEAEKEISESKRIIEDKLEDSIIAFSYPNGNYNEKIIELLRSHGYRMAFSAEKGLVDVNDNPFTLKRVNIHNDVTRNIPMFLTKILGIF